MEKLKTINEVYDLLYGATASAALGAAIETGLFWALAEKPMEGNSVADYLGIPIKRCHYWLQLLNSLGIIDKTTQGYVPSSLGYEAFIQSNSQGSWKHLAIDERERTTGVHDLALYLQEPGSIWTAQGLDPPVSYVDRMRRSPDRALEFTRMLYEVHQPLAKSVAERLDLSGVRSLMDVGGGSGVVSMTLLRKYPELTATVVDIENVCVAGREIAVEEGMAHRISYYPAEFDHDDFPDGFDVILKCDVSVFKPALFEKLFRSLKPGGRLVLVEHVAPAENLSPNARIVWTFIDSLHDPDFSYPTLDRLRDLLVQAGFEFSSEYETIGPGRILMIACKP